MGPTWTPVAGVAGPGVAGADQVGTVSEGQWTVARRTGWGRQGQSPLPWARLAGFWWLEVDPTHLSAS